jgi:hypothetical protein
MPQLDANVASVVIERVVLQNDEWKPDTPVVPPTQTQE